MDDMKRMCIKSLSKPRRPAHPGGLPERKAYEIQNNSEVIYK